MNKSIEKFAILGERCSGTNFLEETMLKNFDITYTSEYGHKHFFCHNNYDNREKTDSTLFIGIVRNPIYWLNSFSKELYHLPEINRKNLYNFLFNEFYSVHDGIRSKNTFKSPNSNVNKDDLNLNGQKYKNIFEMRKVKNNFLINTMHLKVKNYILINYEDLLFNFEVVMKNIKEKFNLNQKLPSFQKEKKYKKSPNYNFVKQREISFTPQVINLIWNYLNLEQEKYLGYLPFNNNNLFKNKYTNLKS